MKDIFDGLKSLHLLVQVLIVVSLGCVVVFALVNRDAATNFTVILSWLVGAGTGQVMTTRKRQRKEDADISDRENK